MKAAAFNLHKQRREYAGHEALQQPSAAEAAANAAHQTAGSMRGETSPIGGVRGSWAGQIKNDRNAAEEDAAAIVAGER